MIRKTMIDAERDEKYVDEKLCGVNDMTFEEWERYQNQMLRYYTTYQYDSGPYEEDEYYPSEDELFDNDEDHELNENCRSCSCNDDFCLSRVSSTGRYSHMSKYDEDHVCLCDPTDIRVGTCCCNYLGLSCNGKCRPDGYDR